MDASSKQQLRAAMRALRRDLPPAERRDREVRATAHALELVQSLKAQTVALFHSTPEEISTHALIESLLASGHTVALPRIESGTVEFRQIHECKAALIRSQFGVMEPDPHICNVVLRPSLFDLLLTPGLAFDLHGNRLGYGKGHYDRILHQVSPAATLAGFAFEFQVVPELPAEPHDIPVGALVTDSGIRTMNR